MCRLSVDARESSVVNGPLDGGRGLGPLLVHLHEGFVHGVEETKIRSPRMPRKFAASENISLMPIVSSAGLSDTTSPAISKRGMETFTRLCLMPATTASNFARSNALSCESAR